MKTILPGNAEPQLGISSVASVSKNSSKEWYSRGYLPHRNRIGLLQSVTYSLADSLPQTVLNQIEEEIQYEKEFKKSLQPDEAKRRKMIENYLDSGFGCCALQNVQMATLVEETFLKFDGRKYILIAWCIMPNHVHVLIEPRIKLSKIVQSWKSYTGRWAVAHNAELGLGVPGKKFWMREYWDRFIRDEKHLHAVVAYIHNNPVKAKLCPSPEDWPWSSAFSGS